MGIDGMSLGGFPHFFWGWEMGGIETFQVKNRYRDFLLKT